MVKEGAAVLMKSLEENVPCNHPNPLTFGFGM
jgi:hypothetical protein